jgi:ArsR family transcriptional regulator, arsenate/arsenite/antimonite-responsive transcriptional repressor
MNIDPATLLAALADATRLRIISLLTRRGEMCVCELVAALDTPQPKVSKHLAILRGGHIISPRRAGQWIHYRINPELPTWATQAIAHLVDGCTTRSPFIEDHARLADNRSSSVCR